MNIVKHEHIPLIVKWERQFPTMVGSWLPERHAEALCNPDCRYLLITAPDGSAAGFVLLCGVTSADRNLKLKRIVIAEPGRGLGRRALEFTLATVFEEMRAHRIWLDVFEDNHRARHLYRSLGFQEDGILREVVFRDGAIHNMVLMSMLDREYEARKKARSSPQR